jgi:hypothetical protein
VVVAHVLDAQGLDGVRGGFALGRVLLREQCGPERPTRQIAGALEFAADFGGQLGLENLEGLLG